MKRAYDDVGRSERRATILAAAEALLRDSDGDLPSVARIAAAAGLAKGTIYLYFRTKEEILAALLHDLWLPMFKAFERTFPGPERSIEEGAAALALCLSRYCDERLYLVRLDAIAKEVIERNMTPAALHAHRAALYTSLLASGERFDRSWGLPAGRGFQILIRTHALMRGLWQSFGDPMPGMADHAEFSFATELREATAEYLRGALIDRVSRECRPDADK